MFFKANFLFLLSSNEGDVAERGLIEQNRFDSVLEQS